MNWNHEMSRTPPYLKDFTCLKIAFAWLSELAPSQWEMVLLCNNVSHWLNACLESVLQNLKFFKRDYIIYMQFTGKSTWPATFSCLGPRGSWMFGVLVSLTFCIISVECYLTGFINDKSAFDYSWKHHKQLFPKSMWARAPLMSVNLVIIVLGNGWKPVWFQAIARVDAALSLIRLLGTNFSKIWIKIQISFWRCLIIVKEYWFLE